MPRGCSVSAAAVGLHHTHSGTFVPRGTLLLEATGRAGDLHRGAKTAQIMIELASGIATRAAAIVAAARSANPLISVACTRKNMPGAKQIALKAIMAGGAVPHPLGLSDSVLVFADHRVFLPTAPISPIPSADCMRTLPSAVLVPRPRQ